MLSSLKNTVTNMILKKVTEFIKASTADRKALTQKIR